MCISCLLSNISAQCTLGSLLYGYASSGSLTAVAGEALGHTMKLLDIGGGFTGRFDSHGHVIFGDIARTINSALSVHFPADSGVRVIAEPGRYFAETSAALIVPVYGKRDR